MRNPKLLDLFCGAGGCSVGYHRAGFDVVGVDLKRQPRYPYDFIQGDAIEYLKTADLTEFSAIHASPPCQKYSMAQNAAKNRDAHPDLVGPVRESLRATGLPYVIENVVGAPMEYPILMCGLAFGLKVKRHRLFESNLMIFSPPCPSHDQDYFVIFGHEVRNRRKGAAAGRKNKIAEGRAAMEIDWMSRGELSQAIPPAYTHHIGAQLLAVIERQREKEAA